MDGKLYESIGGAAACHRLSTAFYARVKFDPALRPLFPGKTLKCAIEEFAAFLCQFLGGPPEEAQRRWWLSLRESHARFRIGQRERDAWLKNMAEALSETEIGEPARSALRSLFERASIYVVNAGQEPAAAGDPGGPLDNDFHCEIARRWSAQLALDETVAAIRHAEANRAIELAETYALQTDLKGNRAVFASLLASMIRSGNKALLDYVRTKLSADPALAQERYSGRTLLHGAAAAGSLAMVQMLLDLDIRPDTIDSGGHTALYCLANENNAGGGEIARALILAGANVNACGGVKRCTALHMAARRGNVDVAEALLDCGADIEAKDSLGETPLRRAVNCARAGVVTLLITRGADIHSPGSKGLTPLSAARTSAMRRLLQAAAQ